MNDHAVAVATAISENIFLHLRLVYLNHYFVNVIKPASKTLITHSLFII